MCSVSVGVPRKCSARMATKWYWRRTANGRQKKMWKIWIYEYGEKYIKHDISRRGWLLACWVHTGQGWSQLLHIIGLERKSSSRKVMFVAYRFKLKVTAKLVINWRFEFTSPTIDHPHHWILPFSQHRCSNINPTEKPKYDWGFINIRISCYYVKNTHVICYVIQTTTRAKKGNPGPKSRNRSRVCKSIEPK